MAKNKKWGFVDSNGNETISLRYDEVGDFKEGLAVVVKAGKCGFVDKKGKEIISLKYDKVESFSNGLAVVCKSNKETMNTRCVFIDKNNKVVFPRQEK